MPPLPSLLLSALSVPHTLLTKQALMDLIDQYISHFSNHSLVMQRMKKSIAILFADRALLQHTNTQLFKANMAKTARIRRKNKKRANSSYGSAFGRVITPAQAETARKKAMKKEKQAKAKKLAIHNWKLASAIKKKKMEEAKQAQLQARLAKKRQKKEEQRLKALNPRPKQRYSKKAQRGLQGVELPGVELQNAEIPGAGLLGAGLPDAE